MCFGYGGGAGAVVGTIYLKPDSLRLGAHVAYAGYVVAVQAALGWQHNGFQVVGTLPGGADTSSWAMWMPW